MTSIYISTMEFGILTYPASQRIGEPKNCFVKTKMEENTKTIIVTLLCS